ncbi:protein brunelleschi-like isoform X2 [Artemia franciscana]
MKESGRESRISPSGLKRLLSPQDIKKKLRPRSRSNSPEGAISPYRRLEIPPDLSSATEVCSVKSDVKEEVSQLDRQDINPGLESGHASICSPQLSLRSISSSNGGSNSTASQQNTRLLFYPSLELSSEIETDLLEFLNSLYWILESKRVNKSMEKIERVILLCAPFERRDVIGIDNDSKSRQKKKGRWKKHIGDLALQAGLPLEALELYNAACEILRSEKDFLWLAGALEGLASASVMFIYPDLKQHPVLQRVSSFCNSSTKRFDSTTRSLPTHLDVGEQRKPVKYCLSPDGIIDKYHEAIVHYTKFRNAGPIEAEASIKAVQVLIKQKKNLRASEFLQNVVFIHLQLSDDEKIHHMSALSNLYKSIGFYKKSSFFKRIAAMKCIASQNPQPNWNNCYNLLYEALPGYGISLDPNILSPMNRMGWVSLQVQLLQELISVAKRMGNFQLAVRHASLLLHALADVMNPSNLADLAKQVEALASNCECTTAPLVLANGTIVPPVNLLFIPLVKVFKVMNLPVHLRPQKITPGDTKPNGPFIYAAFQNGANNRNKDKSKVSFNLVAGEVCDVLISMFNPMPFELKVTEMQLLVDGVDFDSNNVDVTLPVGPAVHKVILTGIPRESGELIFTGYSSKLLGIRSQCKLKNIPHISEDQYTVRVIESLPVLNIVGENPRKSINPVNIPSSNGLGMSVVVYGGESCECNIMLFNNSTFPVDIVDLQLLTKFDKHTAMFTWSDGNLKSQLPIKPQSSASLTVYVHGNMDFLCLGGKHVDDPEFTSLVSTGVPNISFISGPGSLFSRLSGSAMASIPIGLRSQKSRRAESSLSLSSHRSGSSSKSSSSRMGRGTDLMSSESGRHVSIALRLNYSGGPGFAAGYTRSASVSISVEIVPSILVTKWDMMPSEMPDHVYLVLDILNVTQNEIEIQYAKTKCIAIEGGESCRIPVPVERCPLSKLEHLYTLDAQGELQPIDENEVNKICCEHLASLVDLSWVMNLNNNFDRANNGSGSVRELTGKANLNGIVCTPAMLSILRMYPVQFNISVNGESWSPEKGDVLATCGVPIRLAISISNKLNIPIISCKLKVQCCLDFDIGQSSLRLDGRLIILDGQSVFFKVLSPGEIYSHSCGICFLTPGKFKIEVQCSTDEKDGVSVGFESKSAVTHCWKFTPPIDVNVT